MPFEGARGFEPWCGQTRDLRDKHTSARVQLKGALSAAAHRPQLPEAPTCAAAEGIAKYARLSIARLTPALREWRQPMRSPLAQKSLDAPKMVWTWRQAGAGGGKRVAAAGDMGAHGQG